MELGLVVLADKIVVSSRRVAEVYGKEHKDVLRAIRTIVEQVPEAERNFAPSSYTDPTGRTLDILAEQERRMDKLEASQEHIKATLVTQPQHWRQDINRMFNLVADKIGQGKFAELRRDSYKRLEERARVDLDRRLQNLKLRLMQEGATRSTIDRANRMDVIEADPKLREIYAAIIKEYTISYVS